MKVSNLHLFTLHKTCGSVSPSTPHTQFASLDVSGMKGASLLGPHALPQRYQRGEVLNPHSPQGDSLNDFAKSHGSDAKIAANRSGTLQVEEVICRQTRRVFINEQLPRLPRLAVVDDAGVVP